MIRLVLSCIILLSFMLMSCSLTGKKPDNGTVSEELKKELIAIQNATMGHQPDQTAEELIANIKKYSFPQTQMVYNGTAYSREELFKIIRARTEKVLMANAHDRKFVSAGDTVFVQGLFDRTVVSDGEKTEHRTCFFAMYS